MNQYDCISPLDYRYYGSNEAIYRKVHPFLSERANIRYCLMVEVALVQGLARRGFLPTMVADDIAKASQYVTAEEVYETDKRIHHYTRAIVEGLRDRVSEDARPFIHLFVTSFDIMDTAMSLKLRDFVREVTIPDLLKLESVLISLARDNSSAVQIGRTHGQHAVPITFGFAVASYVDRLGSRIERIRRDVGELRGKLSGAVGAYNAISLAMTDPENFEEEVLNDLGLRASKHSTQIVPPEYLTDLMCSIASCFGILANIADDMRHLQRTEISEVYEQFGAAQVGSSTMPHKRNPWNFEHVKSLWKEFTPRIVTILSDQISEHQRDLTNSATRRFLPEILVGFTDALDRTIRQCGSLRVDRDAIRRNLQMSAHLWIAEPIYILLSLAGLPDAHEYVRSLSLQTVSGTSLLDALLSDPKVEDYVRRIPMEQLAALRDPEAYSGVATRKTHEVCDFWENALLLNSAVASPEL
jgi:adenylosuccinate lyase